MNWYSTQELVTMHQQECRSAYRPAEVRRDPYDVVLVIYTVIMIIVGLLMVLFPEEGVVDPLPLP